MSPLYKKTISGRFVEHRWWCYFGCGCGSGEHIVEVEYIVTTMPSESEDPPVPTLWHDEFNVCFVHGGVESTTFWFRLKEAWRYLAGKSHDMVNNVWSPPKEEMTAFAEFVESFGKLRSSVMSSSAVVPKGDPDVALS